MVKTTTTHSIPLWACPLIDEQGLKDIESAVHRAETTTTGEIVPMLVFSSTPLSTPRRVLFLGLITSLLLASQFTNMDWYSWQHVTYEVALAALCAGVAFFAPLPPWLMRLLMTKLDQQRLVEQRAEVEFYRCRIHHTHKQTGILLFISVAEHRAVVLGDQAIAKLLPPDTWDQVLRLLLEGIRSGHAADGMVKAIEQCGTILAEHFPYDAHDRNELGNHLIFRP